MAQASPPKRPRRPTRREIARRIRRIHAKMEKLAAGWNLSNGQLRHRIRLLERRLKNLLRQLQD